MDAQELGRAYAELGAIKKDPIMYINQEVAFTIVYLVGTLILLTFPLLLQILQFQRSHQSKPS